MASYSQVMGGGLHNDVIPEEDLWSIQILFYI